MSAKMRVPVLKLLGFVFWLFFFHCVQCRAKQKLCRNLSVDNGFAYRHTSNQDEIFYSCNKGYKPFDGKFGNWWDSVTCSEDMQSEEPLCIREEVCGAFPSVHHGKHNQLKNTVRNGVTKEFECDPGFRSTPRAIKCVRGSWETPVCEVDVRCNIPTKVEDAVITSKPEEFYVEGSRVTYACRRLFSIHGKSTVLCHSGTWETTPTCKEVTCPLNTTMEHLTVEPSRVGPVKPGHKLFLSCKERGMRLKGQSEITCQSNGEWSSPFPKCEEVMCVANLTANMRSFGHTGPVVSVRPGETVTFLCAGKESQEQELSIICKPNGEWNAQLPRCGGKCGPPPNVEFADTLDILEPEYNSGVKVEYSCFNKYTLVEREPYSKYMTCEQGQWRGNIKCLKPCTVTVEEMDERGIYLRWRGREKIFSPHEDKITFACQWPKKPLKNTKLEQTCNDGVMTLPECVRQGE